MKLRELTRSRDQRLGSVVLDDPAVLHHEHAVGDGDRREAVRDDDRRPVCQQGLQSILNRSL